MHLRGECRNTETNSITVLKIFVVLGSDDGLKIHLVMKQMIIKNLGRIVTRVILGEEASQSALESEGEVGADLG